MPPTAPDAAPATSGAPDPAASGPIVELRGVRKGFGPQVVLDGIDIAIERGKITVILGPSGSGKSVLLKCIVGLLRPDAGEIYFNGQRIDTMSESHYARIRCNIGFVFQLSALFDSMDVFENLAFPFREHTRLKEAEIRRRVIRALRLVDLRDIERKLPAQLSGGQQKRVAFARAVIQEPDLVLYDEPTTGLDPVRASGINALIKKLQRELGVTGVVVTHDLESARTVGDRVLLLYGGQFIADGTYDEVSTSTDPRVRGFLSGQAEARDFIEAEHRARVHPQGKAAPVADAAPITEDGQASPSPDPAPEESTDA